MKRLSMVSAFLAGILVWLPRVEATPIPCMVCGSTPLTAAGIEGTVSFAVITGANFNAELTTHNIGFFGLVPQGTLGPTVNPPPTDFVYLYQLVNNGPSTDLISSWTISGGAVGPGGITAGTRLESTLLVDPAAGLVSAGAAGGTVGLGAGPSVNFQNGLGPLPTDPVPSWGSPCLGSAAFGVQCSDGQADLMAAAVQVSNWQETPSGVSGTPGGTLNALDPLWSGSVIWFASPFAPTTGLTSIADVQGLVASGTIPVPGAVPEPLTLSLIGIGLAGLGFTRRLKPQ